MGPHDLLCKWCSTFVGRGQQYCSIFCEKRFSKNRRRKYISRHSKGGEREAGLADFDSPHSKDSAKTETIRSDGLLEALASNTRSSSQRYDVQKNVNPPEISKDEKEKEKSTVSEILPEVVTGMTSGLTLDNQPVNRKQTKTAAALAKRVKSSGYGAPVNPKLRPLSLKPRSATMLKRGGSAKSNKSNTTVISLPDIFREESRVIETGRGAKWELISTIVEESRTETPASSGKALLDDANPLSPLEDKKNPLTEAHIGDTSRSEQKAINDILREVSSESDLPDQSLLQERLSSIKRKVEVVRRKGRESRSSMGSEIDTFRMEESSLGLTTDRDTLNTSSGTNSSLNTSSGHSSERKTRRSSRIRSTKH